MGWNEVLLLLRKLHVIPEDADGRWGGCVHPKGALDFSLEPLKRSGKTPQQKEDKKTITAIKGKLEKIQKAYEESKPIKDYEELLKGDSIQKALTDEAALKALPVQMQAVAKTLKKEPNLEPRQFVE